MHAGAAAREEDDDSRQQVADGGNEHSPRRSAPLGAGAVAVTSVVNLVADDGEADEVGDEDDEGDDERH